MVYYRIQMLKSNYDQTICINLRKERPRGNDNFKIMREKERISKGKFIKKSELL